jgi:hypothetical protein
MAMNALRYAFKEWAVICRALAEGGQAIVLRKGGIAEAGGDFRVEHTRFWLYPTYAHQQATALAPEAQPLLRKAEADRPPEGTVRLTHFAEVAGIYHLQNLVSALRISGLHLWSPATVQTRFAYRAPGLYVLAVRVYRAPQAVELPETPEYAGCRSWVDLGTELSTEGAVPVLDDEAFNEVRRRLDNLLEPTALA